jgi:hypothetical protein
VSCVPHGGPAIVAGAGFQLTWLIQSHGRAHFQRSRSRSPHSPDRSRILPTFFNRLSLIAAPTHFHRNSKQTRRHSAVGPNDMRHAQSEMSRGASVGCVEILALEKPWVNSKATPDFSIVKERVKPVGHDISKPLPCTRSWGILAGFYHMIDHSYYNRHADLSISVTEQRSPRCG